jgi:F-type H+-transporting ATPase subunit b
MFFLADFSVIKPDPGLIFWTTIIFGGLWYFLGKKAFGPISEALKAREEGIADALAQAEKARHEMSNLKSENEALLVQAREERALLMKEAKETRDSIVNEAKDKAKEEASRLIQNAKIEIENQQKAAMLEVKNKVGAMAIEIAEKILRKQLSNDAAQVSLANTLVNEIKI